MEEDGVCADFQPCVWAEFGGRGGEEVVKVVLSKTQERGWVNLRPSIFPLCRRALG